MGEPCRRIAPETERTEFDETYSSCAASAGRVKTPWGQSLGLMVQMFGFTV